MKRLILSLLLFCSFWLSAQSPQGFNYQTVVRDANGDVITNQICTI